MTKEAISKAPERRVRRTPVGRRNVLTVAGKEPGFQYRFVNDKGDRIHTFLQAGYELVDAKDVTIGDSRVDAAKTVDSKAYAQVGGGTQARLMRIPDEWFAEDQAAKQAYVKQTEDAMREKALDGNYGEIKIG